MNILIIDDNATNLKLTRAILESENHTVYEAMDGVEGLAFLEIFLVDAIISDVLMPNMDGYRFCQEVRKSPTLKHIPFIFYTATYTSQSDEQLALDFGADRFIRRPAPAKVLIATLNELMSNLVDREPLPPVITEEQLVMKHYSEALVRKLEAKNLELEQAKAEISRINEDLEERVEVRTAELFSANEELEAFSHSAAHDLRSPLRAINSYSVMVLTDEESTLSEDSKLALVRVKELTMKMNWLIDELLKLSHVRHVEISKREVDLSSLVSDIVREFREATPSREVETLVTQGVVVQGDEPLLRIAFQNLVGNAWKYTEGVENPKIEFGLPESDVNATCFIRDNGVGFDMAFANNIFKPFHRLHSDREFPGSGLGLTIVQRVISRHRGTIWADSAVNSGATFFMSL